MMPDPTLADLIKAVDDLASRTDVAAALNKRQDYLDRQSRGNRLVAGVLAVIVAAGSFLAYRTERDHADALNEATHAAQHLVCIKDNTRQNGQRALWAALLALPSDRPPSPDVVAQLNALLDRTFAPATCT